MRTVSLAWFTLFLLTLATHVQAAASVRFVQEGMEIERTYEAGRSVLTVHPAPDLADALAEYAHSLKTGSKEAPARSLTYQTVLPGPRGTRWEVSDVNLQPGRPLTDPDVIGLLERVLPDGGQPVSLGQRGVFRDLSMTEVALLPYQRVDGQWHVLDEIRLTVQRRRDSAAEPLAQPISPAFREVYRSLLTEDELDELGQAAAQTSYILVAHPMMVNQLQNWIDWREQTGSVVHILETDNNPAYATVKFQVQTLWNTLDVKPDYILLVGDPVFGNAMSMPGDHIESEFSGEVITDYDYVLLEGNDYWPEAWVGRFSVTNLIEAQRVGNKTVLYEQGAGLEEDSDWLTEGLVICDNTYSSTGLTSSWIRREMLENGFSDVDSVWFPPTQTPGPISTILNQGVSWVNYRGFGNPTAWTFPVFTVNDVIALTNAHQLPVVTSIVCGGGDFESASDPCLGEAFLRAGSLNEPTGGVAFIGPSEHNTHTRWNNCLSMNLYTGLLHEGYTLLGPLMFRGKMGIYNGFPNNRYFGTEEESVFFYFFTYNLLGDPGLRFRTGDAVALSMTAADTLPLGTNDLPVLVTDTDDQPQENIPVTLVGDGFGPVTRTTDATGHVRFDFTNNLPEAGTMTVTAAGFNTIPAQDSIVVAQTGLAVALENLALSEDLTPDAMVTLAPTLQNVGTSTLGSFSGVLTALEEGVTVTQAEQDYNALGAPGNLSQALNYQVQVAQDVTDGFDPGLVLELEFDENQTASVRIPVTISAPRLVVLDPVIEGDGPGAEETVSFTVRNDGSAGIEATTVRLAAEHPWITMTDSSATLPSLNPGNQAPISSQMTFSIGPGAYRGWELPLEWTAATQAGRVESGRLQLHIGEADSTNPLQPDAYGYAAFDNLDTSCWQHPTFSWFEVDPEYGGDGNDFGFTDNWDEQDESAALELPFDFSFYGQPFDTITVCTNGWLQFGDTGEVQFRNWNLEGGPCPNNLVAPFWDDLVMAGGRVVWLYQEELGRFIVQWSHMKLLPHFNQDIHQTFQAILYDPEVYPTASGDGVIEFHYLDVMDGDQSENYSTVGIRNADGRIATQLSYASQQPVAVSSLTDGRAYRLTTDRRPEGPAIRVRELEIVDDGSQGSEGDGDGNVDNNETIALNLTAVNLGGQVGEAVTVTLNSPDPYITIEQATASFGAVDVFETEQADQAVTFSVSRIAPDRHRAVLQFEFSDADDASWTEWRIVEIYSSLLRVETVTVYDPAPGGNGNNWAEAGETVELAVRLRNDGRNGIGETTVLVEPDANGYAVIDEGERVLQQLNPGQEVTLPDRFVITIANDCPEYTFLRLPIRFVQEGEEYLADTVTVTVGEYRFYDDFEVENNGTWGLIQGQWHVSSLSSYSPSHSLYWGAEDGGEYMPNRRDRVYSNMFSIHEGVIVNFAAKWNLGMGDTVVVALVEVGADSFPLLTCTGIQEEWETFEIEQHFSNRTRNIVVWLSATSNPFGAGTGFYIDDFRIREGGLDVEENQADGLPREFALTGPYPNPFNPQATLQLELPHAAEVQVEVFDVLGRRVDVLMENRLAAGRHELVWRAENFASGVYFIRMRAGNVRIIRKATVLK